MITSPQNERVKLVHALQTQSKARRKEGKVALEGVRLIRDALQSGFVPDFILYDPDAVRLEQLDNDGQHLFLPVAPALIRQMSDTEEPQGVVGVFPLPQLSLPKTPSRLLILDTIRDPGNLGTILRTSAAAGVEAIILTPGCVDAWNPKVLRGGMGAHFRVPMRKADWDEISALCQGLNVYLASSGGDVIYHKADWSQPWALIIGNEAHGGGEEAGKLASSRVKIPMAAASESINAAVAAGIILFESVKHVL